LSVPVFSESDNPDGEEHLFLTEVREILEAEKDRQIGSFTVGELQEILEQLSVAHQQELFISRSKRASFLFPGAGQHMNRDHLSGSLFMAADLALVAGTLIGAYYLLPADLRFDQLNYFTTPAATIKDRWKAHSMEDLLPAMGATFGGSLLRLGLRFWSSAHARKLARDNVDKGTISFQPLPLWRGFGMKIIYR
jgi:hypothetical protein